MALCDKCIFMQKEYDDFQRLYDDAVRDGDTKENHFCPMYDDRIPQEIYYDGAECEYFSEKEG